MQKTFILTLYFTLVSALFSCDNNDKQNAEFLAREVANTTIKPINVLPNRAQFDVGELGPSSRREHKKVYFGVDMANVQPVEFMKSENGYWLDAVELLDLQRDTEYLIYVEYTIGNSMDRTEPLCFKTPLTVLDVAKTYAGFKGHKTAWTCFLSVIEGNVFSVWGEGGFDAQTKVEFVERDNPTQSIPAQFQVVNANEISCTVPDEMTRKSIENYELMRTYCMKINGQVLHAPVYNDKTKKSDSAIFYVNNTMPIIEKMKPIKPNETIIEFYGALFSFSLDKDYLNIQKSPDDQQLWITQGGVTRSHQQSRIWGRFVDTSPELKRSEWTVLHTANGFQFPKNLLTGSGETTVWIDFHFGAKTVSTNKFTFEY